MGATESTLQKHGYTVQSTKDGVELATSKEGDSFVIKVIPKSELCDITPEIFSLYFETLKNINHPHVLSYKNSFEENDIFYLVSDNCQGQNLAEKIKEKKALKEQFTYEQIMQWTVQICMALKYTHENDLIYKDLSPQRIFITEFGNLFLGELNLMQKKDMAPEHGIYMKSRDIWLLGCVIYELCTLESFTETHKKNKHPYSTLPRDIEELLNDTLQEVPSSRPTASDILGRPFIINCLMKKCKETTEGLQENLKNLRDLADGLEKMHWRTTVGSLTGGVIGAAGGITSIVGLIMAPFTLGASLVVTGVGIGVAVAGGATAGASNITNMVKQSNARQDVRRVIKEFEEKVSSVVTWLKDIGQALEELKKNIESAEIENGDFSQENLGRLGVRVGRGLGGMSELVRLIRVVSIGRVAAQTSKVVRVAEVVTGVFSALFVAVDVFFIAMDAREIHRIKEANEQPGDGSRVERSGSRLEMLEADSDSEPAEPKVDPKVEQVKSETMKFVITIRQNAQVLQEVVDDLKKITSNMCDLEEGSGIEAELSA